MAAEVNHFAYGWINPVLAYVLSVLGSLLGLVLATRSRDARGSARLRWLVLAAVAIGGTGIWLMHFMALLGFEIKGAVLRYDVAATLESLGLAVVVVALGLCTVGFGRPTTPKVLIAGLVTGVGLAGMYYAGMRAVHFAGRITYDPLLAGLSVLLAVVTATAVLWFAVTVDSGRVMVGAAFLMGFAACSIHYAGMAAVRVQLVQSDRPVTGVSPFHMLTPVSIGSCVMIIVLAYATVGFSVRQEHIAEEALLERTRSIYAASLNLPEPSRAAGTAGSAGLDDSTGALDKRSVPVAAAALAGHLRATGRLAGRPASGGSASEFGATTGAAKSATVAATATRPRRP